MMKTTVISKLPESLCAASKSGALRAVLLVSLAGFGPSSLPGQEVAKDKAATAAAEPVLELNPFIVTHENDVGYSARQTAIGNRVVKQIVDIPSSISIVNSEMLRDLGATDARLALQYGTAGTTPTNSINDDTNMRGFRTQYLLRDGVLFLTNKKNPMWDVERVEIIKGPAGMLIGATNYLGGVVNFVSKQPTEKPQGSAGLTIGSEESLLRGEINQSGPLKRSPDFTALYRVNVGYENYESPKPNMESERTFIGGGLTFKFFQERLRLDFNAFHYIDNGLEYYNDFLDLVRSPATATPGPDLITAYLNPRSTRTFVPSPASQNFEDTEQTYVNAVLTARLTDNGSMRLFYTYSNYIDKRRIVRGISLAADNVTLSRQDLYQRYDFPGHILQAEYLYKTVRSSWRNDIQGGAEVSWIKNRTGTLILTPPALNTANPDYTYNAPPVELVSTFFTNGDAAAVTTGGSYWIQDNLTLFHDKLILVGGLRWSDSKVDTENLRSNPRTTATTNNPLIRTHRYGVVFQPFGKQVSLYYADAKNLTPNLGLTSDQVPKPFLDSEGIMEEFGIKFEKSTPQFNVYGNFAHFDMALTNVRTSAVVNGNVVIVQTKQDNSKGWEAELGFRYKLENSHADLIVTYSDITTIRAADGGWAPEAPENVFSLWGKYTWTSSSLKGLTVGGGVYDQTKKRTGNTYYVDYPATYNLLARYDINERWSVQLNGDNLTDEYYITTIATPGLVLTTNGAQYRLTATYRW
ncbi:MAG: TonB-dependent receptor [Opitutaceae bacterium]|nr:TonB-dependent receptor [Opitutaceae bacterium]